MVYGRAGSNANGYVTGNPSNYLTIGYHSATPFLLLSTRSTADAPWPATQVMRDNCVVCYSNALFAVCILHPARPEVRSAPPAPLPAVTSRPIPWELRTRYFLDVNGGEHNPWTWTALGDFGLLGFPRDGHWPG